ncbi:hypothetical protein GCM10010468_52480 [Actinocorallia longicatena]|uniref:DUF222 domain-containing protein n=1 Tax=Actinocorallia longicatena TaxID=111803 RepID=A0ABP6QEU8_9ACTN
MSFAAYAPVALGVSACGAEVTVTAERATMADLLTELDALPGGAEAPELDELRASLTTATAERRLPSAAQIAEARKLLRPHPAQPEAEAALVGRAHRAFDVLRARAPEEPDATVVATEPERAALEDLEGAVRGLSGIRMLSAELFVLQSDMRSASMDVIVQISLASDGIAALRRRLTELSARTSPWRTIVATALIRALADQDHLRSGNSSGEGWSGTGKLRRAGRVRPVHPSYGHGSISALAVAGRGVMKCVAERQVAHEKRTAHGESRRSGIRCHAGETDGVGGGVSRALPGVHRGDDRVAGTYRAHRERFLRADLRRGLRRRRPGRGALVRRQVAGDAARRGPGLRRAGDLVDRR